MTKIDLKKVHKNLYSGKPGVPIKVEVPTFNYLMVDGKGYPGTSQEYQDAMQTLYPISYAVKFAMKSKSKDYTVMPIEGLWWAENMNIFTDLYEKGKDQWLWTSMILQPDFVTKKDVDKAIKDLQDKEKPLPLLDRLRFEKLNEGTCGQIMHIGSYSDEGPNIQKLHKFIQDQGGDFEGQVQKHHEIYLSDPRRTKPERLKTVIRQPYLIK